MSSDLKKFGEGRINCLRDHVITLGVYQAMVLFPVRFGHMTQPWCTHHSTHSQETGFRQQTLFHVMEAGIAP